MNKNKKVSKKPTIAQLTTANTAMEATLKEKADSEKCLLDLVSQLKKELDALKPKEEITEFNADDLCLNIKYKKDDSSKTKNYYGKLVNAFINHTTGARYFHLLGEDNQTRIFRKDKTENADEVQTAVEKLFALRKAAAEADRFAA